MKPSPDICARLSAIGKLAGGEVELAETALLLGLINCPGAPGESYRRHLEKLSNEVGAYAGNGGSLEMRVEALNQVIVKRYGYGGTNDAYEDSDNANLMRAIDRRCGLPVVLGIIYIHVARSLGWTIDGLNFPARFLVRLELENGRVIMDPFDGGIVLDARNMRDLSKAVAGNHAELTPGHYQPMTNREILIRLQNHVKLRLLRCELLEDALGVLETMLLFAPDVGRLWREVGLLNARLGNIEAAVASLEEYLRLNTGDTARYRASILLQELRGRLS